jgi:hypothetical protein
MYTAGDFYKEQFGTKVVKLAFDGGFTCPNRDGTLSDRGCIFCSSKGSGDFSGGRGKSISEQYSVMVERMSEKWGKYNSYIAYFQAFTNTYAPIDRLRAVFEEAVSLKGVVALSIGTRPDCLGNEVIELLKELNKRVYVIVELGLQTTKEDSVELINRCYPNEVYKEAVSQLKAANLNVVTHIILGLPNESVEDMQNTVNYAIGSGTDGIKLQLLHVIEGTLLAKLYRTEGFKILEYEEYVGIIADICEHIPSNIVIHRVTGDGDRATLIEPRWSLDKRRVLNGIAREFIKRDSFQGKLLL